MFIGHFAVGFASSQREANGNRGYSVYVVACFVGGLGRSTSRGEFLDLRSEISNLKSEMSEV
jgi:hypothetical protein